MLQIESSWCLSNEQDDLLACLKKGDTIDVYLRLPEGLMETAENGFHGAFQ